MPTSSPYANAKDVAAKQGRPCALIIDNSESDTFILGCYLQQFGYAFDTARSFEDALKLLEAKIYDVVFVDVLVPKLSGPELVRHSRSHEQKNGNTRTRIIAMTASTYIGSAKTDPDLTPNGYLTKPCNPQLLAEKLGIKP